MILIASGAFVDQELALEQGMIPPSMMHVANRRLFELQVEMLRPLDNTGCEIILTLPESYNIGEYDSKQMVALGIRVIRTDPRLSLGHSILSVLQKIDTHKSLTLLLGDTLILGARTESTDFVSTHRNRRTYFRASQQRWNGIHANKYETSLAESGEIVISGLFRFSEIKKLADCIEEVSGSFVDAINRYGESVRLDTISSGDWLDFGHVYTYWDSRTVLTTERAFNSLQISKGVVTKRSATHTRKIRAEAEWYDALPMKLRKYIPQLLTTPSSIELNGSASYSIEYLPIPNLSEGYVFDTYSLREWSGIFDMISEIIDEFSNYSVLKSEMLNYDFDPFKKSRLRLEEFIKSESAIKIFGGNKVLEIKLLKTFERFLAMEGVVDTKSQHYHIVHGDMCFSNLLYDQRAQRIRCIDPRGEDFSGKQTIYGDVRYDLAKLAHSVIGGYDHIIAGRYSIVNDEIRFFRDDNKYRKIECDFWNRVVTSKRGDQREVLIVMASLFAAMLPLHFDRPDRQTAFICNFIRIVQLIED